MRRLFKRMMYCTLALAGIWLGGLSWFIAQIPSSPAGDNRETDAIVVLTGGRGRIDYGLRLLSEGRARRLFVSGVDGKITPRQLTSKAPEEVENRLEEQNADIMLGYDARNTIGNALEIKKWMREENIASLRLVTTNYHVPRAMSELRYLLGDMTIIPDPVLSETVDVREWWKLGSHDSRIVLGEYHKLVAALARHALLDMMKKQPQDKPEEKNS